MTKKKTFENDGLYKSNNKQKTITLSKFNFSSESGNGGQYLINNSISDHGVDWEVLLRIIANSETALS